MDLSGGHALDRGLARASRPCLCPTMVDRFSPLPARTPVQLSDLPGFSHSAKDNAVYHEIGSTTILHLPHVAAWGITYQGRISDFHLYIVVKERLKCSNHGV